MPEPIAEGLFTLTADGPRLIGGRRKSDGRVRFPMPTGVGADLYEPLELAPEGRLWSFTVQRFRPKTPPYFGADDELSFKPYPVGYVELAGQVIVEGRIETDDVAGLRIGMPMRVDVAPFATSDQGERLIHVFRPGA